VENMDFDRIYKEYFKTVYAYILGMCGSQSISEEITQETFYKALKNIDRFRGESRISTWLCQIAKNSYFTYCKKERFEPFEDLEQVPDSKDFVIKLEDKEMVFAIHKHLHGMEEPYKEVFTLRVFGELSFLQIANLFDKTESWARVTFYRSKKMIRTLLEEPKDGKDL